MSILKNIERIDLSNNLFENVEVTLGSLSTMPNLKELNISYSPSEMKQKIEFYLPHLEVFNSRVVKAGAEIKLKSPLLLDDEGGLKDGGKKKEKKFLPHGFLLFDDELTFLRNFHQKITQITAESNSNPKDQTRAFLSACKGIDECIRFSFDYNEKISEKVKSGEISTNFETYEIKRDYVERIMEFFALFLKESFPKIGLASESLFKVIMIFLNHLQRQSEHLQKHVSYDHNNQDEEEDSEEAEEVKEGKSLAMLKINELEKEVKDLKKENDDLYNFLIANSKKEVLDFCKKQNMTSRLGQTSRSMNMTMTQGTKAPLMMKSYSLPQVKLLVHDIMENKASFDERAEKSGGLPQQLEEFLYVYFKQKYGLKDLILVEITSLMDQIKYVSPKSAEVSAFKGMLKNEIDEKFYWLLQEIKKNMVTNLDVYYKVNVTKNASLIDIEKFILRKKSEGLERNIAEFVLDQLFNDSEVREMKRKLKHLWNLEATTCSKTQKKRLPYSAFQEMILGYALETHIEYLRQILGYFRQIDHNHDGMFRKRDFLDLMDIFAAKNIKANFDDFMNRIDPNAGECITFSKVIEILSTTYVDKEKRVNMIQFLRDD